MSSHFQQNHNNSLSTNKSDIKIIQYLMPYLWPKGELSLKIRVALAILFLIIAKISVVYVPYIYKEIIDSLEQKNTKEIAYLALPLLFYICQTIDN